MPAIPAVPFTAVDVQDKLLALLNADPDIAALIVNSQGETNEVLDDDPTTIDQSMNIALVVTLAAEGEDDATLGGSYTGKLEVVNTFAVMVYVYDERTSAGKRACAAITGAVRQILMRYRQAQGTDAQGQLWYMTRFRKRAGGDVTTYYTTQNFRLSTTFLEVVSQIQST